MKIIRRLYDWCLDIAKHPRAEGGLAAIAFIESSVFPIPPDVTLIPMCMAQRDKAFRFAGITTLASTAGGLFGYGIGYFFYATIGQKIIHFYGMEHKFTELQQSFDHYGGWLVFTAGVTPIPYKIMTITSGVMHLALPVFLVASIIGRGVRFYFVAWLIKKYGAPIQGFIEKNLTFLTFAFTALLIGGFFALKYLL